MSTWRTFVFACVSLTLPMVAGAAARAAGDPVVVAGLTEPYRSITIKAGGRRTPPFSARISRVAVSEGDVVQDNDVLVEMDASEDALEARVRRMIADSKAEIHSAQEKERTLGALLEASRKLYLRTKSISMEDLDRKELEYRLAVAERQRLEVVKEREKAEAELADASLAKRTIRSPIGGTVVKVYLHEGETAEPNDALVQLVDTTRGFFVGNVEEKVGRTLERGQRVGLKIQTGSVQAAVEGTITFVSPVVDPASGLLAVRVEFPNLEGNIRPGVPGQMIIERKQ